MMMMKKRERGATLLEFTLVGIPLMFLLISTVEMARGMWTYETLAHAVRQATRFTVVKGQNCGATPNSCTVSIARIAQEIQNAGIGLDPATFTNVTFTAHAGRTISHATLQDCLADTTQWPTVSGATPDPGAAVGADIEISVTYPFRSALSMFWPGTGQGVRFGVFYLPASSRESIQF